jgi:uncharacterized protein YjbI with pentapeptide repeats
MNWPDWTGLAGRTAWDWAGLIGVPLTLAIIALIFSITQSNRDERLQRQRIMDSALQAYTAQLVTLANQPTVVEPDSGVPLSKTELARTLTRGILGQLDAKRKAILLNTITSFVVSRFFTGDIVSELDFSGADFSETQFGYELLYVTFPKVILRDAIFGNTSIVQMGLPGVDLSGTDLSRSYVHAVTFDAYAKLANVNFHRASLYVVTFEGTDLRNLDFSRTSMTTVSFQKANLSGANFSGATLIDVDFTDANLNGARFKGVKCPKENGGLEDCEDVYSKLAE